MRRAGRGRKEVVNPLVELAQASGVCVLQPDSVRSASFVDEFSSLEADLGIVVSYGQIMPQSLLDAPRLGCVNVHGSLLPRWRGASPVQAAIMAGDAETGVCIQQMVAALDAGDVLVERRCAIGARETGPELFARLSVLSAELLQSFFAEGVSFCGKPQTESAVTFCRKVKKQDGIIDWSLPAYEIDALVRAYASWPCGQTTLPNGEGLKILIGEPAAITPTTGDAEAPIAVAPIAGEPGEILSIDGGILVACGQGSYRITKLQRQGKAPLPADDFLRGVSFPPGAKLG